MNTGSVTEVGVALTGVMTIVSVLLTWAERYGMDDFRDRLVSRGLLIVIGGVFATVSVTTGLFSFPGASASSTALQLPASSAELAKLEGVVGAAVASECRIYQESGQGKRPSTNLLTQYWLTPEQGGRAGAQIEEGVARLQAHGWTVGECGRDVAVDSTRVFVGDYAEVITSERTSLPPADPSVASPYQVVYRLRNVGGVWKIEAATTSFVARFVGPSR